MRVELRSDVAQMEPTSLYFLRGHRDGPVQGCLWAALWEASYCRSSRPSCFWGGVRGVAR